MPGQLLFVRLAQVTGCRLERFGLGQVISNLLGLQYQAGDQPPGG